MRMSPRGGGNSMGSKGVRKSHRKSRGGCSFCKRRRIKCDEKKPSCSNCVKRSLVCSLDTSPSPTSTPGNECASQLHSANAASGKHPTSDTERLEASPLLDVQDLQLFHHFCSFTSTTFAPTTFLQQFWNITVAQMSFSHPFLLRAVLAIGGLHMNQLRRADDDIHDWYKTKATAHWDAAIRLATPRLADIDEESCDPLFIFAMLSCLHTFAAGPQSGNFLLFTENAEVEWPIFFRGLRSVSDAAAHLGTSEPSRSLAFMYKIAKVDLHRPRELPETSWSRQLDNLRQGLLETIEDDAGRRPFTQALDRLDGCFLGVFGDGETTRKAASHEVFGWLYHVSDDFLAHLREKDDVALVFYAFFVVLLRQMSGVWMLRAWPEHLISGIYRALSPAARPWLQWPMERIGWWPEC